MRRGKCSGSATVEAALVMPLILGVIVAVLVLGFYTHDRAVIEAAAEETSVRIARRASIGDEGAVDAQGLFQERVRGRLFLLTQVDCQMEKSATGVRVLAQGYRRMPGIPTLRAVAGQRVLAVNVEADAGLLRYEEAIRLARAAGRLRDGE